jgi:formylglycine-generating enzyme required for sulfatase activity
MRWPAVLALVLLSGVAQGAELKSPFRDCGECPEMVVVPAGSFLMGTVPRPGESLPRAEREPVLMRIPKSFALGRFELTRREFRAFLRESGYEAGVGCRVWNEAEERFELDRARGFNQPVEPRVPRDDHPANCLSFADAKAYVGWLAKKTGKPYRLPSEAEWEYAARAGSTARYPWGEGADEGCEFANLYDLAGHEHAAFAAEYAHCNDGFAGLAPVGALRPNAFGLFDMIGNVAEWVEDCYTDSYAGRPRDARAWIWTGGCNLHGLRGGSWLSPPAQARVAVRGAAEPTLRASDVGVRVALDLEAR